MRAVLSKIRHVRVLVAKQLREIKDLQPDSVSDKLDKARVVFGGAKVLGDLINDTMREEEFEQMQAELAEIKKQIGLKAVG